MPATPINRLVLVGVGIIAALCLITGELLATTYVTVGAKASRQTWVYLCGLSPDFNSAIELDNRKVLEEIGQEVGISFIAINPQNRCEDADNQICWLSDTPATTMETHKQIEAVIGNQQIQGYIGFSNGAFFLNKLSQIKELNVPIIAIAGSGTIGSTPKKNTLYLLFGSEDPSYDDSVQKFIDDAKGTSLDIEFISYKDSHVIPKKELIELFRRIMKYPLIQKVASASLEWEIPLIIGLQDGDPKRPLIVWRLLEF